MISKRIESMEFADVVALVDAKRAEDRRIDFKMELPGGRDDDKKELLADVSSFANADGGDLIFGVRESDGVASEVTGLDATIADATILRLEALVRDGLQPRIVGVRSKFLEDPDNIGRGVLVMRIPASMSSPHQVVFARRNRFYTRHSKGKAEMDVNELRQAFVGAAEALPRLRSAHGTLPQISPVPLAGPSLLVSVMPLSLGREHRQLELRKFEDGVIPSWGGSLDYRQTLEGFLMWAPTGAGSYAQAMTYRAGWVETWTAQESRSQPDQKYIWAYRVEEDLEKMVRRSVGKLRDHGIEGPWLAQASLLTVKGYGLYVDTWSGNDATDRELIRFSEVILDEVADDTLLPIKRELWWAFGVDRPDGWKAPK